MAVHVGWVYGYRLEVGGVERHLLSLLRHAPREQYRFTVIGQGSADFVAQARSMGARWIEWHTASALDLRAVHALAALVAEHSIDLVHTHSPNAMLLAGLAARWRRRPHVLTVQMPAYDFLAPDDQRRGVYQLAERIGQHALAQAVIYASQRTYAIARRLGVAPAHKSCVIENGIEFDEYPVTTPASPPRPLICCVARLEYQKGLDVLLEALARLQAEAQVLIVGEGGQRVKLEARVRELKLMERVTFVSHQSHVAHYLQQSQIFVLPSRFEGLAFALLEALATGLPCVVTDVGDHGRVITSGENGLVVPPNNPQALAAALESLLRDHALRVRLGAAARRTAEAYSAERMAQRTFAVYERVLNP
ncbi:MAG: glycosyltransferase family 4 protein [Anaerolineales bacterium]